MDVILHDDLMRLRIRNNPANVLYADLNITKKINERNHKPTSMILKWLPCT
jgi:hypothetical protein